MKCKIAMIGAGSFFTDAITEEMCRQSEVFGDTQWVLMDVNPQALELSLSRNKKIIDEAGAAINIECTTDRRAALAGCDFVITSFDRDRVPTWIKDLEIPEDCGLRHFMGENGGPGGQAHAMRNITVFMGICRDMRELCPDAWIMNFTNPMSFVSTYLHRYGGIKALGFCHQPHGSMGVVSEMLGFEPGELQVLSAGINHFNWLLDIRIKGTGVSFMDEFIARVMENKWWKQVYEKVPEQVFTLEMLETFGMYPVGYDSHICEYVPFFYAPEEWAARGYTPRVDELRRELTQKKRWKGGASDEDLAVEQTRARGEFYNVPFPRDGHHPYYRENPTAVIEALVKDDILYLDNIVIPNHGSIDNLPDTAVVDIPAVVAGGEVRSVHVGALPTFAMELCRRQITIHELLVEATVEGDRQKVVQSMALDPYVRSMKQAREITDRFLDYYQADLPQFSK